MNLQQLLIGTFVPPPVVSSRLHSCGFASEPRYEPPIERPKRDTAAFNNQELAVLKVVTELGRHAAAHEIGEQLGLNRNHCSMILSSLFKKGVVLRFTKRIGSVKFYMYKAKPE